MRVLVGADTGVAKFCEVEKRTVLYWGKQQKDTTVTHLCWEPSSNPNKLEQSAFIGLSQKLPSQTNSNQATYESIISKWEWGTERGSQLFKIEGELKGLETVNKSSLLACTEKGQISLWGQTDDKKSWEQVVSVATSKSVSRMRMNPISPSEKLIECAMGGKENDLNVWRIDSTGSTAGQPFWKARNVKPDTLDMRVPVWITDLRYVPGNPKAIAVCTGYQHVRLYDINAQRRPSMSWSVGKKPLISLALSPDGHYAYVSDTIGTVTKWDFRKPGTRVSAFGDMGGSVRGIEHHESQPFIAVCGLDRFLRIYNSNTTALAHKLYMKQKMNCLLFSKEGPVQIKPKEEEEVEEKEPVEEDWTEAADMWESLPTVGNESEGDDSDSSDDEEDEDGKAEEEEKTTRSNKTETVTTPAKKANTANKKRFVSLPKKSVQKKQKK